MKSTYVALSLLLLVLQYLFLGLAIGIEISGKIADVYLCLSISCGVLYLLVQIFKK